jgi:hypothetical protein
LDGNEFPDGSVNRPAPAKTVFEYIAPVDVTSVIVSPVADEMVLYPSGPANVNPDKSLVMYP